MGDPPAKTTTIREPQILKSPENALFCLLSRTFNTAYPPTLWDKRPMKTRKKRLPAGHWEHVLVRHVVEQKRNEIERISSLLRAPFADSASTSCEGGSQDTEIYGRPTGRWMIAARLAKQSWLALFSNAATGEEMFDANAASRRLEVAWFGGNLDEGRWFIRLKRGGKSILEFAQSATDDAQATFKSAELAADWIDQFPSPDDAFRQLCEHYDLSVPNRTITATAQKFQVIGQRGKPVKSGLNAYVCISGPKIAAGESPASADLDEAIEECDLDKIRQAVEAGASLEQLPDSTVSPLLAALFNCDKPNGRECAELLIELGCPVDGQPGDNPPIVDAVRRFVGEDLSLKILDVLVARGADVDAIGRDGATALFEPVVYGRNETVRALIQHGADPNIESGRGVTPIEWVQSKLESTTKLSERRAYGETLSLLTGEPYEESSIEALDDTLQSENDRFIQCRQAEMILKVLPQEIELRTITVSRLAGYESFSQWEQELLDLGFESSGNYIREALDQVKLSAYTNEKLRLDAVLSAEGFPGDTLRCEIDAYAPDGSVTTVVNHHEPAEPDYAPAFLSRHEFLGASPSELVGNTKRLLGAKVKKLVKIQPQSFADRFRAGYNRILDEVRQRAEHILDSPTIVRSDGHPPRYERLRFYLDFSSWDDPTHSSARFSDSCRQELEEAFGNDAQDDPFDVEQAISASCDLVGMQHYQFAGAPEVFDHLDQGVDLAVSYFERGKYGTLWSGPVEAFAGGLLLAMLADRWQDVGRLCEAAKSQIATRKGRISDDPPVQYAQFFLVLASHFRKRPFRGLKGIEESIAKGRPKRPRLLLKTWRAVRDQGQRGLDAAFQSLLEGFEPFPLENRSPNEISRRLAFAESIVHLAALRSGLECPTLSQSLLDLLITPETIGLRGRPAFD